MSRNKITDDDTIKCLDQIFIYCKGDWGEIFNLIHQHTSTEIFDKLKLYGPQYKKGGKQYKAVYNWKRWKDLRTLEKRFRQYVSNELINSFEATAAAASAEAPPSTATAAATIPSAIEGTANSSSCVVPTAGAGGNMKLKALLQDGKKKLEDPGGFAHVENIIDANGRTSVSRQNDSSLSVIVNGAGVNSKTVNNITCGTNITFNYTSALSESRVKELVKVSESTVKELVKEQLKEQLRKEMASISKWGYALCCIGYE